MYLKKLSLKGFKSFPVKTDIFFEQGVTAIVGPNGSGKSNTSDAVRWVLGEQSVKSLRGDKMEDVIFSGTDSKKQMNYCEVSLTLDNDPEELIIKRRAYRTGESEYYINNKICRLKDVRETLLDTGIGKDGYSIIEQGKVDEILSNNPANRRNIFDEACGIAKYRYKKNEAEKNLKKTDENLSRIIDIFSEIENQLAPLEKQQEKAKKYLTFSEELKTLELNDMINQNNELENAINDLNFEIQEVEKTLSVEEANKENLSTELETLDKEVEAVEKVYEGLNEELMQLNNEINKSKTDFELTNSKIEHHKSEIERKNTEVGIIKKKSELDRTELKKYNEKADKNSYLIESLEAELGKAFEEKREAELKLEKVNSEIDKNKNLSMEIIGKREKISNQLATLEANINNLEEKRTDLESKLKYQEENKLKLEKELKEKNEAVNSETSNFKKMEEEINYISKEISSKNNEVNSLTEQFNRNRMKMEGLRSKRNTYVDMENHHEGFNRGVKEVLKNKNLSGLHGAFGELIKVPQKYEKAVEASLGAMIQNIVVDNEKLAKDAINYLKKNKLGRVTFLPLNIIKSNKVKLNTIKSSISPLGLASDLIEFNDKYRNVVESLLGRVVIIENIDQAIVFAKETGHRYKIVTLEGEILNPGGSMTGGSLRTNSNILSRKRLIDELGAEIKNETANLEKISKEIEEKKAEVNGLSIKKEEALTEKSRVQTKVITLKAELKVLQDSSDLNKRKFEGNKVNLEAMDKKLSDEKENKARISTEIETLSTENQENTTNIDALIKEQEQLKKVFDEATKLFNERNLNITRERQLFENCITDIERISKDIEESDKKIKAMLESSEENKKSIVTLEELNLQYNAKIEKLDAEYIEVQEKINKNKKHREEIREKAEEKNLVLRKAERSLNQIREDKFKLDSKLERSKSNKDNLLSNLFEKYEMTFVQALEFKVADLVIDKKRMESLRRSIRNLGNVNVDSIEEYEEVKERHDYYKEQKEDLEKSIVSLKELIDELVVDMEKEFLEKFNTINENFKFVYKKLFGGGKAELKLTDKQNILSCDIDIIAQPPGKKMKNLTLLSGGEKALTAIAILFAILISKPTPFCILDEIEAPLDDVNVDRFGEYLKELSSETQFIAVTHRRGTMEVADFIYGVTMQEKGVSSVISIKLKDAEELID